MPLRAIVFDFDGVIADTEPLHLKAFRRVLADMGIRLDTDDYYQRYLGFDDAGVLEAIAAERGLQLDAGAVQRFVERKAQVLEALVENDTVLFAGVRECIARCAAHAPLAIASGALGHEIDLILRRAGMRDAFPVIVGAGDTPRSKPAPDPYALAVRRLAETVPGLTAGQCVAIEDSRWGLASARAAGLRTVAVAHTYAADSFGEADFVADTLADITIERLQGIFA